MALTRADFEAVLVKRCGAALAKVSLDGTTIDGTNADLADPIRTAVRAMGYVVADPIDPADADLADVPATRYEALFDLAELRALETVLANWTGVDEKFGQDSQANSQYGKQLESRIKALCDKVAKAPNVAAPGAVVAKITAGRYCPSRVLPGDPGRWPKP